MRRNAIWGLILLLIGALLLLDNLGYLAFLGVSVWQLIWPTALIGLGVWFLIGARFVPSSETREVTIAREGAGEAKLQIEYGAGEVLLDAGPPLDPLLTGTFDGGVSENVTRTGDRAQVSLSSPSVTWGPWHWGPHMRRRWDIRVARDIPLDMVVKTGASDCRFNLEHLRVTRLRLDTGASSIHVTLPAEAGTTEVTGASGAASLQLRIPRGVAARIQTEGGLSSTTVDQQRFPRRGNAYQSSDYETAENRVDIRLQMGVGSIDIR